MLPPTISQTSFSIPHLQDCLANLLAFPGGAPHERLQHANTEAVAFCEVLCTSLNLSDLQNGKTLHESLFSNGVSAERGKHLARKRRRPAETPLRQFMAPMRIQLGRSKLPMSRNGCGNLPLISPDYVTV